MKKPTKAKAPAQPPFGLSKHTIETFRDPSGYWLNQIRQEVPSCFNGDVSVRRWRVTVEEIAEPDNVLAARILDLWDRCDNHHHVDPLRRAASKVGLELNFPKGTKLGRP